MADTATPQPPRPPEDRDLIALCRELNAQGAKYLVVGGMAIIQQGYLRATEDIDLLVQPSEENRQAIVRAMEMLPGKSAREITARDFDEYIVVRIVDDLMIDLMMSACGISYEEAVKDAERVVLDGVTIPFASAETLLKMKQTYRDKDEIDRVFLQRLIAERNK
ncbi:MAG: nucleotidyl transferase AbiEii/AbiGii toxin family protein [Verrucomicrobia bacterium]|nr:nucleotidyl transferase AbiEii/AbiGii toxin family protein [Verrucomicrobiota bacterium]